MRAAIILLAVILIAAACSFSKRSSGKVSSAEPVECGTKPVKSHSKKAVRLQNGDQPDPDSWPWHMHVRKYNRADKKRTQHIRECEGVLVPVKNDKFKSDIMLTSTECVRDSNTESIYDKFLKENFDAVTIDLVNTDEEFLVFAGLHDKKTMAKERGLRVEHIFYHYWHNPEHPRNRIALMKLKEPIPFSETVRPICLTDSSDVPIERKCFISGFDNTGTSTTMTQLEIKVLETEQCRKNYAKEEYGFNVAHVVCGRVSKEHANIDDYDKGNPLACLNEEVDKWELFGTVLSAGDLNIVPGDATTKLLFASAVNQFTWIEKLANSITAV